MCAHPLTAQAACGGEREAQDDRPRVLLAGKLRMSQQWPTSLPIPLLSSTVWLNDAQLPKPEIEAAPYPIS